MQKLKEQIAHIRATCQDAQALTDLEIVHIVWGVLTEEEVENIIRYIKYGECAW